ncbi:MAG: NAD(P)/FAD-dependent oxidoreductase, partial [Spirosomaceae bacterium]|nr:NAD(P)/FAD-dependent oxidoreductase [Spirosomataceae bacterium]
MKKTIAIIGGGTAGLFLADFLDNVKFDVAIYEKNATLGRKFLVAGDGGFNLTHSEALANFKTKYTPSNFLDKALDYFSNEDFQTWLQSIGIPTFVGSSGRVFPEKGIKPIKVLKAIEAHLKAKNVKFQFNKNFTGWAENHALQFNSQEIIAADYVVFALGGASWRVTGSDGSWLQQFVEKGIATTPFKPANCAYEINWQEHFIDKHEGKPLKNIAISISTKTQKGEAVITKFGIEGNAIYGLSPEIQTALDLKNEATVYIDFKPTVDLAALNEKLSRSTSNVSANLKENIKLPRTVIDLLKSTLTKE